MKTVLITGASGGIGAECVKKFLSLGYNVAASYKSNFKAAESLREYACKSELILIKADISSKDDTKAMFDEAIRTFGRIDTAVNCAGISIRGLVQDMSEEEFERITAVNIDGCFYVCQCAAEHMIRNHFGSIINISSMWGQTGASCEAAYSMTKAAVIGLTKALAKELGPSGIRVNCVSPGLIDTQMNSEISPDVLSDMCEETPLMRMGKASETADLVAYLAGEEASFVTGQIIGVNGGYVI